MDRRLETLPPCSPDYNPIELSFVTLKAWIHGHIADVLKSFACFEDFLRYAMVNSRYDKWAPEHFQKCGDLTQEKREAAKSPKQTVLYSSDKRLVVCSGI